MVHPLATVVTEHTIWLPVGQMVFDPLGCYGHFVGFSIDPNTVQHGFLTEMHPVCFADPRRGRGAFWMCKKVTGVLEKT